MKIELTQPEAERLLALLAEFPIKAAGDLFTKVQKAINEANQPVRIKGSAA